jgi:lysophospholipase L1-like esterase
MHSYQQATYAKYRETFPKALDALGIEYIDTDSWLSQGSNEDAFWADQVHFGEVGQEWMGKHLAEYIEFTINSGISHK